MNNTIFSREQLQILESPHKFNFVIACPGSGKTTLMVQKIQNLINQGIDPKKILWLSFTRLSINDVNTKLKKVISEEIVRKMSVKTFHGFCKREVEGIIDDRFAIYRTSWAMKNAFPYKKKGLRDLDGKDMSVCWNFISWMRKIDLGAKHEAEDKNKVIDIKYLTQNDIERHWIPKLNKTYVDNTENEDVNFEVNDLINFYQNYLIELKRRGVMDFDGAIDAWLTGNWDCNYQYIFIDEFQDISLLEKAIIDKIINLNKCKFFLAVGDPNQSIYMWRGGIKGSFARVKQTITESFPEEKIGQFFMRKNFRSSLEICCTAEGIHSTSQSKEKSEMDLTAMDSQLSTHLHPSETVDIDSRLSLWHVLKKFVSDPRPYKTMFVLFRDNAKKQKYLDEIFESKKSMGGKLENWDMITKQADIKDSQESAKIYSSAILFELLFGHIFNVPTADSWRAKICQNPWNISENDSGNENRPLSLPSHLWKPEEFNSPQKIKEKLESIMNEIYKDGRSRRHFQMLDGRLKSWSSIVHNNIKAKRENPFCINQWEEVEKSKNISNKKQIIFSTVHAAKGLEADWVVYLFPQFIDANTKHNNDDDEEININFVAITRARARLALIGNTEKKGGRKIPLNSKTNIDEYILHPTWKQGLKQAKKLYQEHTKNKSITKELWEVIS